MLIAAGEKSETTNSALLSTAQEQSLIPNFGVALFDKPREMSGGWACEAFEKPFKFDRITELSNDTLWVTNLDFELFKSSLSKFPNFRRAEYLRSTLTTIAGDFGMSITEDNAMKASDTLARVLYHTLLIAIHAYKLKSPSSDLRGDQLSDDIRRLIPSAPKPLSHTKSALTAALQSYSKPNWSLTYDPQAIFINMRYNRLNYARKIMTTMVPDDAWSYLYPEQIRNIKIEDLLNPEMPCLVEAAVDLSGVDPDKATLIAFGAGNSRRSGIRKWISQPELAWLSRHANVRVSSAIVSNSARPLPIGCDLPANLTSDPLFSLSLSVGLVAESHWNAIASTPYNKLLRANEVNSWAVWLRAVDRSLSFSLALKAHDAGFRVTGYGNGSIQIRTNRERLKDCLAFADANDIFHPAFNNIFVNYGVKYD